LSEEEFDSLSEALEHLGGGAMNLEQLDGFLASLVCGPEEVSQTEWLREVLGFDVMNHAEAASELTA
jgi:yecA family protein